MQPKWRLACYVGPISFIFEKVVVFVDSILGKIQVPYDSYLVLSDNDFASTGIFANQD